VCFLVPCIHIYVSVLLTFKNTSIELWRFISLCVYVWTKGYVKCVSSSCELTGVWPLVPVAPGLVGPGPLVGLLSGRVGQHHLHLHAVDHLTVERRHGVIGTLRAERRASSLHLYLPVLIPPSLPPSSLHLYLPHPSIFTSPFIPPSLPPRSSLHLYLPVHPSIFTSLSIPPSLPPSSSLHLYLRPHPSIFTSVLIPPSLPPSIPPSSPVSLRTSCSRPSSRAPGGPR